MLKPPHDQEVVAVDAGIISVHEGIARGEIRRAQMSRKGITDTTYLPGAIILGPGRVKAEDRLNVQARSRPGRRGRPHIHEKGGVARVIGARGRALPFPRNKPLSDKAMNARLMAIDIGQVMPLRIGQMLVRDISRGPLRGKRFRVTFGPGGFITDDLFFGGLSSALSWFLGVPRRLSYLDLQKPTTRLYGPSGELIQ